jgi:hypothetical protein
MSLLAKSLITCLALSVVLFAGCKSAPMYEVVAAPIPTMAGKTLTMDEITKAMVRAGARAGWQVAPERPGVLVGHYAQGQRTATVGIEHDTKAYSIKFRDSTLRSDGASIHRLYNTWVQNLDRSIRVELIQ